MFHIGQKLDFLKKYNHSVNLVSINDIKPAEVIPAAWKRIFEDENSDIRVKNLLELWEKNSGKELRNTISYLNNCLKEVDLIEIDGNYSILYTIESSRGKTLYYEGKNPNNDFDNEELEESWSKIPKSITRFYDNIHNGFYFYASESMGLVPKESVTYFDEYEWGIIEELNDPIEINLKTTFGFFTNGMGTYVAIDHENSSNDNATLWSAKKRPKYNINFWDVVDEWIVIGFEA